MATELAMMQRSAAALQRHVAIVGDPGHVSRPLAALASRLNAAPRVQDLAALQAAMIDARPTGSAPLNNRTGLPGQLKAGAASGVRSGLGWVRRVLHPAIG